MSYDVYWVKNRAEKIADFEHPTLRRQYAAPTRLPQQAPTLPRPAVCMCRWARRDFIVPILNGMFLIIS